MKFFTPRRGWSRPGGRTIRQKIAQKAEVLRAAGQA
jgi:hypothetical protein